jgi:DNA modification methylase
MPEFVNQLHYGDNLVRLRGDGVDKAIPDEVADLIYLDPPFNSARNYNLLFRQHKGQDSPAQIMTFEDTWTYSPLLMRDFKSDGRNSELFELMDSLFRILGPSEMMAYLLMMAPRLLELHRKLKPTGSLYLHCDPVASHYLKIILDVVFGPQNFRNEITWKRATSHNDAKRKFGDVTDSILFFSKTKDFKFNVQYIDNDPEYLDKFYRFIEPGTGRRYALDNIASPNPRPNLTYSWRGFEPPSKGWRYSLDTMEKLYSEGLIVFGDKQRPRRKRYADSLKGLPVGCLWDDIGMLQHASREHRGYPTQKPLALLERIIAASTDEGDVVLDPFAGCGTAMVAAERMNRRWIGIDVTYLAINEVIARLNEEKAEGRALKYELLGTPRDEAAAKALFSSTAHQNHKPFEQWAVTLVGGKWNDKKGADRGVDGRIQLWDMQGSYREGLIQVKGGNGLNLSNVRDFAHVIENSKAVFGIMIAQREPTKEMRLVAENLGYADWPGSKQIPRYQIFTTEGILERGERPILPESWLISPDKGVGRMVKGQTETLFD